MKPARFEYVRPKSLAEAADLLRRSDGQAKVLAGGQSLGPMLNLRLARPALLVDITGIAELRRVEEQADAIVLGACITHANIEDGRVPDPTGGALRRVAGAIAYRAVRNRGTIGGSLAHADPAADWLSTLAALGAEVVLHDGASRRSLAIEDFVTGAFETALGPGELLEAVRIPRPSRRARFGYCKLCRKPGEFAHAMSAVLADPERAVVRAVIGAIDAAPIVLRDAGALFGGESVPGLADRFDPDIAQGLLDARGLSDPIDRQLHLAALKRAIQQADGL